MGAWHWMDFAGRLKEHLRKHQSALRRRVNLWWLSDSHLLGRLVELTGNRWTIHGVQVELKNPFIDTKLKGRFVKGTYEREECRLVRGYLPPDMPVVELGACIGVLSCLTNKRLHNPRRHVAVEANPNLLPTLHRNRELNGCSFEVLHAALAYDVAEAEFYLHHNFLGGSARIRSKRVVRCPAITLEDIARRSGFERFNLIADIEGTEVELVQREGDCLKRHVEWFILETHPLFVGKDGVAATLARLRDLGFRPVEQRGASWCFRNRA